VIEWGVVEWRLMLGYKVQGAGCMVRGAGVTSSARREERVSRSVRGRYLHCRGSRYIFPARCSGKTLELTEGVSEGAGWEVGGRLLSDWVVEWCEVQGAGCMVQV